VRKEKWKLVVVCAIQIFKSCTHSSNMFKFEDEHDAYIAGLLEKHKVQDRIQQTTRKVAWQPVFMEFKQEFPEYTASIRTFMDHWTLLIHNGKAPPMICGKRKFNTAQNTKSNPRPKAVDESCQDIPCMNESDIMVLCSEEADMPDLGELESIDSFALIAAHYFNDV
jgi:hypothetical protein